MIEKNVASSVKFKLLISLLLLLIADLLFYKNYIGWTFGLFGLSLLISMMLCQNYNNTPKTHLTLRYAAIALIIAIFEDPSSLSFCLLSITLIAIAIIPLKKYDNNYLTLSNNIIAYIFRGWFRIFNDTKTLKKAYNHKLKYQTKKPTNLIKNLILPIILSIIFIKLFSVANPIIDSWLNNFTNNLRSIELSLNRIFFWFIIFSLIWALIRPRFNKKTKRPKKQHLSNNLSNLKHSLFNQEQVVYSLVIFNIIFLIQNILDLTFLWSGAVLPNGMSFASYAHKGAYPLIFTALLAAGFVLIAGKLAEDHKLIRSLVYVWVGQNIFLVISSIIRLQNYIGHYSLTHLRIAALIWMFLVMAGLLLIIARLYYKKDSIWLINNNFITLYCTLFICCFINFNHIIAVYNIQNHLDNNKSVITLDYYYLQNNVGFYAIPALIEFEHKLAGDANNKDNLEQLRKTRRNLQKNLSNSMLDLRRWSFRKYRINHFEN
jgi:hypothetical protein